jgi:hypothetical protein
MNEETENLNQAMLYLGVKLSDLVKPYEDAGLSMKQLNEAMRTAMKKVRWHHLCIACGADYTRGYKSNQCNWCFDSDIIVEQVIE